MSNRSLLRFCLVLLACFVGLIACRPATPATGPAINVYAAADLGQTTRIDVLQREDGQDSTPANTKQLVSITDRQAIQALVGALDEELQLVQRASCPGFYTLVFHLADGSQVEFDYACQMMSPAFLRGGQSFWQWQEAVAPDSFNQLLSNYLGEAAERRTPFTTQTLRLP